jgi:Flp pilus assembly protein TadD
LEPRNAAVEAGAGHSSHSTLVAFVAITLFAFALRFVYLAQAHAVPMFDGLIEDGEAYGAWSDRIVAGDWLGDQVFYQAPLYPYFLGIVKLLVGKSLGSIRLVQIAIGSVSCGILFLAGKQFFSRGVGIAAGILLALYPPAIFFDGCIQKANLGLLWTVLLLLAVARAVDKPSIGRWLAAGATLGLLMLTREETILLAPVIAAWIYFASRARPPAIRARWIGGWFAGLVLVLLPVAIRNYAVGGELVLTTSQAGSNFYIGNNPRANGTYVPLKPGRSNVAYERRDAIDLAEAAVGHSLSPKEVSDYWFARALEFIRAEPGKWLGLMLTKINLVLNAYESADAEDQYFYERFVPMLAGLGAVLHYGIVLPLAAAGVVLTWRRWSELSILYAVLATLYAGVVIFYVFARYRYPVVPILILFAGAALVEGISAYRARGIRALGSALLALGVMAVISNNWAHPKDYQLWEQYSNSGVALTTRGDDARAIEMFQRAIEIEPTRAELYGNMGISLQNLARYDEAIAAFRRALELRPDDARAFARLGNALWLGGRATEAIDPLQRAVNLAPANGEYWSIFGRALSSAGQWRAAIEALRKSRDLRPADPGVAAALAWELATSPDVNLRDGKTAVKLGEEACRRTDDADVEALDALAAAYAETGRFNEAATTGAQALSLAGQVKSPIPPKEIQTRIDLYRSRKPFHRSK